MVAEVAPNIYTVEHRVAEGKNGVIIGRRAAVALDTGSDLTEGQAVAAVIRDHGRAPDRLILTHGHNDHVLGSAAFAEAEVVAHALTPDVMRKHLPAMAAARGLTPAALAAELAWPTITFSGELWLDLGGRTVHLFPAPGHSDDGICAYVPEERLLFGGDAVVTGIVPAIGDGDSRRLEASLRRLLDLDIDILVPGHGPVLRGAAVARDWLNWLITYLGGVRQAVRAGLDRGETPEAIVAAVDYARFVGDQLPDGRHSMPRRHQHTVGRIIAEEAGG